MDNMKSIISKLGIIALVGIVTLQGCKKGENDPLISLKSRDARITGTWELTSQEAEYTYKSEFNGESATETTKQSYDGNMMTETYTETYNGQTESESDTYDYSFEMTIDKDGTYSLTVASDGDKQESSGNWWWLSDKKNKTRIALDDDFGSFEIDQLKNKELILTSETSYKNTDADGYSSEETQSMTMTFTKK
jgi:hypothetical protein